MKHTFISLQDAMFFLKADPKTSDPLAILEAREEPFQDDTLDDILPFIQPVQPAEEPMPSNNQLARFFSAVSTNENAWTSTMQVIANTAMYQALYNLFQDKFWSNVTEQRLKEQFGVEGEDLPTLDLRNTLDESKRTESTGESLEDINASTQGARTKIDNVGQAKKAVTEFVCASRELSKYNMVPMDPVKQLPNILNNLGNQRNKNAADNSGAIAAQFAGNAMDRVVAKAKAERTRQYAVYTKDVLVDVQSYLSAVSDDEDVEDAIANADLIRQHKIMLKTVERILDQRRQLGSYTYNASPERAAELLSDITALGTIMLDIDDIADAFVREHNDELELILQEGRRSLYQYAPPKVDRDTGEVLPTMDEELKQLRVGLNRPKRTVVKAQSAAA